MRDQWLALVLDESKWLTIAIGVALLTVAIVLSRHRGRGIAPKARMLGVLTLLFSATIGVMAFGHLLAVSLKLLTGTLVGPIPVFYGIGIALAVPSWWLVVHAVRAFGEAASRRRLVLNGTLAAVLLVLGLPNLPLAVPGLLNMAYQVNRHRRLGWAIATVALLLSAGLFVGSLVFWASGQTFEQFRGME